MPKNTKLTKSKKIEECCEMTFCGLNKWYQCEFEKLGWMILAHDKGLDDKIKSYKITLHHLHHSLELKMNEIKDADKKHDLKLMHHNVELLIQHVAKDFGK